jgi:hypothetical protein
MKQCHLITCFKRQFSVSTQLAYKNYYLTKGLKGRKEKTKKDVR